MRVMAETRIADGTGAVLTGLPKDVATFFQSLQNNPDYSYQAGRMQLMVYFRGQKVGGLNRKSSHWYLSKVFVRDYGSPEIMEAHGFRHVIHNDKHEYWMTTGGGALATFRAATSKMTSVQL